MRSLFIFVMLVSMFISCKQSKETASSENQPKNPKIDKA